MQERTPTADGAWAQGWGVAGTDAASLTLHNRKPRDLGIKVRGGAQMS